MVLGSSQVKARIDCFEKLDVKRDCRKCLEAVTVRLKRMRCIFNEIWVMRRAPNRISGGNTKLSHGEYR